MVQQHDAPPRGYRGRGATYAPHNRFAPTVSVAEDDGWTADDAEVAPLRTEQLIERPRTIISKNTSPDVGFDRSINPYRGCEHGCIYCYARPTHEQLGLSSCLLYTSPSPRD